MTTYIPTIRPTFAYPNPNILPEPQGFDRGMERRSSLEGPRRTEYKCEAPYHRGHIYRECGQTNENYALPLPTAQVPQSQPNIAEIRNRARQEQAERPEVNVSAGIQELMNMLQAAGINPTQMAERLQNSGAAFAGSSVLFAAIKAQNPQVEPNWYPNDFDIWAMPDPRRWSDPVEALHTLLIESGYQKKQVISHGHLGCAGPVNELFNYARLKNWISRIHIYDKPTQPSVQIMILRDHHWNNETESREPSTPEGVVRSFDITLCQYLWNGGDQIRSTNAQVPTAVALSPGANEQSMFEWIRTFQRAIKYKERGFTLDWLPFFEGALISVNIFFSDFLLNPRPNPNWRYSHHGPQFGFMAIRRVCQILNGIVQEEGSSDLRIVGVNPNNMDLFTMNGRSPEGIIGTSLVVVHKDTGEIVSNFRVPLGGASPVRRQRIPRTMLFPPPQFPPEFRQELGVAYQQAAPETPRTIAQRLRNQPNGEFQFPPDWRYQAAETINRSGEDYNTTEESKCFDFVMATEEDIKNHIKETPNNLILLSPPTESGDVFSNAVCITRDQLRNWKDSETNITLACAGPEGRFPVDSRFLFVRIELREFPVYVPMSDVDAAIDAERDQFFQITPTNLTLPSTASADVVLNYNNVSADHCQGGTSKKIYRLHPVRFERPPTTTAENSAPTSAPARRYRF